MDLKSEKSSVPPLNIDELIKAIETKMWTIPSLTEGHLLEFMREVPNSMKGIIEKNFIPFINHDVRIKHDDAYICVVGPNNQN